MTSSRIWANWREKSRKGTAWAGGAERMATCLW
jgi:hypothetical protein